MKKFIFLFLILIPGVLAGEVLHSGWIDSGGVVPIAEKVVPVLISSNAENILIEIDDEVEIIDYNKSKTLNYINIFYSDRRYNNAKDSYEAFLVIKEAPIELNFERTFPELIFGEKSKVITKITPKTGEAELIKYIDEFPPEFELSDSTCPKVGNSIIYGGPINQEVKCEFFLTPLSEIDMKQIATVDYFDGLRETEIRNEWDIAVSNHINFVISYPLLKLGNEVSATLSIENLQETSVKLKDFKVIFPNGLGVDFDKNILFLNNEIQGDDTQEIQLDIKGRKIGIQDIIFEGKYLFEGQEYEFSTIKKMEVDPTQPPRFSYELGPFESFQDSNMKIWMQNPSKIEYKNIKVSFESDIAYIYPSITESLISNGNRKILDYAFVAPNVATTQSYPAKIKIEYTDEFGTDYIETETKTIKILATKNLEVIHKFTNQETTKAFVTTSVKNPGSSFIEDIQVYDQVENLSVTGKKSILLDVLAGQTEEAYSYLIEFPPDKEQFKITTNTLYSIRGTNFSVTKTSIIDRELKTFEVAIIDAKLESKNTISQGETYPLTYSLANTGNRQTTVKAQILPNPMFYSNNKIITLMLNPGERKNITIEKAIIPLVEAKYPIKALVEYHDGTKKVNKTISTKSLSVTEGTIYAPIINVDYQSEGLQNQKANYNVTISNDGAIATNITFEGEKFELGKNSKTTRNLAKAFATSGKNQINILTTLTYLGEEFTALNQRAVNVRSVDEPEPSVEDIENETTTPVQGRNPLILALIIVIALILLGLIFYKRKPVKTFGFGK